MLGKGKYQQMAKLPAIKGPRMVEAVLNQVPGIACTWFYRSVIHLMSDKTSLKQC